MTDPKLKPMPLWQSWTLFVGLGGVALGLVTLGTPWLVEVVGLPKSTAMLVAGTMLFVLLASLALTLYVLEDRRRTWSGMKSRFRLRSTSKRDWILVLGGFWSWMGTISACR